MLESLPCFEEPFSNGSPGQAGVIFEQNDQNTITIVFQQGKLFDGDPVMLLYTCVRDMVVPTLFVNKHYTKKRY